MFGDALNVVAALIEFAVAIQSSLKSQNEKDIKVARDLSSALRHIYFAPNGIISLLREIADGGNPSPDRIKEALIRFNDGEWAVRDTLRRLDFHSLQHELSVPIEDARTLDFIRMGKISVRRSVQDEVNRYGQARQRPDIGRVKTLLAEIEKLNSEIEKIEKTLRAMAR